MYSAIASPARQAPSKIPDTMPAMRPHDLGMFARADISKKCLDGSANSSGADLGCILLKPTSTRGGPARALSRVKVTLNAFALVSRGEHAPESAEIRRGRVEPSALAEGHVHLSGLTLLAQYFNPATKDAAPLDPATVDELLAAATHKSKRQIEQLLAE